MTDAPLLEVRGLHVIFRTEAGPVHAVRGAFLDVPPGRTVALVGESGSGKSAIAQAILGILPEQAEMRAERMLFRDPAAPAPVDLAALDPESEARRQIRGHRIAMVFQEPMTALSPLHTIGDQIGEALRVHTRLPRQEIRRRVLEMLARVAFPDPERAARAYPFELSGGLRQRAVMAMALVGRPALLVADEPTTALDVTVQAQILALLQDLQAEFGMAVLFITHDLGIVAQLADEVAVIHRGRILETGPCHAVMRRPGHPYTRTLLAAVPRLHGPPPAPLPAAAGDSAALDALARLLHRGDGPPPPPGPLLEVAGLAKGFTRRQGSWLRLRQQRVAAVRDVGFRVARGECYALVGESGSGKTTVCRLLVRALAPEGGSAHLRTREGVCDILALPERELPRLRRHVQYVFQDPWSSLDPRMTVFELVAEPLRIQRLGTPAERVERVAALLRAVGLRPEHMHRYPHHFSGGQRQRIGIARALAPGPELLILDEPVSALDVVVQARVLELLQELQQSLVLAYVFVAHDLAVVRRIAHRVGVMCRGLLVEEAPAEVLFSAPRHPYTRALLAAVPEPDPDRRLDFRRLAGGSSDPAAWPAPFTIRRGSGTMREVAPGHRVRFGDGEGDPES